MRLVGRQFVRRHQSSTEEISMFSTKLARIGLAASLFAFLPAVSAQAQAPRTFVSAAGSDSNPCSFAAPCRHFQAAVNATGAGGEVDALDPAGYGPIIISQAITIEGQGWSYIAPPVGGNSITINAVSGDVAIHGVSLNGVGITGTTNGIVFTSGGSLNVQNSVIRNFTFNGIFFQPNALSRLFVSDTLLADNVGNGVQISPTAGSGTVTATLDHVALKHNAMDGLIVTNGMATQTVKVTISDSVSAGNGLIGIVASSLVGTLELMVRNYTITDNNIGLDATGAVATVRVTRSTITNNNVGWNFSSAGTVLSYADNNIDGNGSANSEPPSPLVYH
jgi:hypothetical protein